jgi:DNA-binding LacI/PurR family transcriptional regulator
MFVPALTTMEVPSRELGRLAVEQLIEQLEGKQEKTPQALVPCRLVERDSVGKPRGSAGEPVRQQ